MSRIRLTAALSIAIILIGGAGWFRLTNTRATKAHLVAISAKEQVVTENAFLEGILEPSKNPLPSSAEPLSPTDVVSRQLFSDYVELSSRGQDTPENLNALAKKYADSIAAQALRAKKVEVENIIIVADSEENLSSYGQSILSVRDKYKLLVENQYRENNVSAPNSPAFTNFMIAVGKLYESSAQELLLIAVPVSLAENHRALVNNHFKSARAMDTLSRIDEDPIVAYTAMTHQSKNTSEEADLLLNIQTTLMANGVIIERGL